MQGIPTRAAGVLLHPTSLPSGFGVGDLGHGARTFVDWLASAGMSLWQVLPLVPPGPGWSPYASGVSMAVNPLLVDLDDLCAHGLLTAPEATPPAGLALDRVDVARVTALKSDLVWRAAERLVADGLHVLRPELESYRAEQAWVADAALFMVLEAQQGGRAWWEWEPALRDREPTALASARAEHAIAIERWIAVWFLVERQWQVLRTHAHSRGVRIVGDLPIYVDRHSADVWAARDQFQIGADGRPTAVAGVPPDYFSELGQLWGNPLYDWARMAEDGHEWWIERLRRVLSLVDVVRIDHFRAFADYWSVEPDAPDARSGQWRRGPGKAFFDDVSAALGADLPIIAEDLGIIDDRVRELRRDVGLPGMAVLQFAFEHDPSNPFLPHNHSPNTVVYTGTHDNDTTRGWWTSVDERTRDHVRRYLAVDGHDAVWDLIRAAFRSVARMAIIPMQDALGLGSEARMNTPGVAEGNWTWRVRPEGLDYGVAARLRELAELYGRI